MTTDVRTSAPSALSADTPAISTRARAQSGGDDYTLRFAPRSYRRWSPLVVATSALGGIAYLADFAIGASIGLAHGTTNALVGIAVAALIIFVTGVPLAYYAARWNIDLDLVTRGSGFGYLGSVVTNLVFASFTFIFFALEGSIMAQGLQIGLGVPLWLGYLISALVVIPLVVRGMKALAVMQTWTTPAWLVLMIAPLAYLLVTRPESAGQFLGYAGEGDGGFSFAAAMLGAGVCLALIAQIAENIDYLRFMPPKTPENSRSWWIAVIAGGPGWVVLGAIKQVVGLFLAVYLIGHVAGGLEVADQPVHQFLAAYSLMMPTWLAMALAVVLVIVSQLKINVTNAYSGSLAWTNSWTRLTGTYPGRVVFVVVNVGIALALMEGNMFDVLNQILSFYANVAIAWIVTVASDIAINKHLLGISPKRPEYRRGMLHAVNPVGFGSLLVAAGVSIATYFGALGETLAPFSPLVAVALALVLPPIIALATGGRYYLRRTDDGIDAPLTDEHGNPSGLEMECLACEGTFERPDLTASATGEGVVCSLCLATDRTGRHVLPAQPVG